MAIVEPAFQTSHQLSRAARLHNNPHVVPEFTPTLACCRSPHQPSRASLCSRLPRYVWPTKRFVR
eukprot:358826-Chlamydomonas_euryale.AAC.18